MRPPAGDTLTFEQADPDDVDLLGGKGSGLARMTQAGLRVPPGYIVSTRACRRYLQDGRLPPGLRAEAGVRLGELETATGKRFGDGPMPLLLSVRSGAPVSMPGMMDTVLNLGLTRRAAIALAALVGSSRLVAELLARFLRMYAETVLGAFELPPGLDDLVAAVRPDDDPGAMHDQVWALVEEVLLDDVGESVPADPMDQLVGAIEAVFRSWNTRRARTYREFHRIAHDLGTAVVVQSMVFGTLSDDSGSGVVFTRNPATGSPEIFGEYLPRSQGEDVVAGLRTPEPIDVAERRHPEPFAELRRVCADLERSEADVLDIEFTIERGRLYLLQVRSAKRTPEAAVRIAADFLTEDAADPAQVLGRVSCEQVRQVQRPGFDPAQVARARAGGRVLTVGIGACPGQVSGDLVLDPDRAAAITREGHRVILARPLTSPADLHGMIAAEGIVTATGGSTSHAAVVARALGKPCVVGCGDLRIDPLARTLSVDGRVLAEGEPVSVDGATGEVLLGELAQTSTARANTHLAIVLDRAVRSAKCQVFGRVTLPGDVSGLQAAGAGGLVTAVDDILAATGHLDRVVHRLVDHEDLSRADLEGIREAVTHELTPLLAAADGLEVGVRAIDVLADEARELMQQTALLTRHPQLSLPLGVPALVEAQLLGVAEAARRAGHTGLLHLTVRHLCDPAEMAALAAAAESVADRLAYPGGTVRLGGYLTSPRAASGSRALLAGCDVAWLEVRVLQATAFGLPARQLLTEQPLTEYLRRGLLSTDPRRELDPSVRPLLAEVAAAAAENVACRVGMRVSGTVAEPLARSLYRLGFRRFAVDAAEVRPMLLALGQAALAG